MCRQGREDSASFCGIYRDLVEVIGIDNVKKVYENFRGQQITFPTHLYTSDYVARLASDPSDNSSIRKLSSEYGYSVRHIARRKKQLAEESNGT